MEITERDNMSSIITGCSSGQDANGHGQSNPDFFSGSHEGRSGVGVFEGDILENWTGGLSCPGFLANQCMRNWNASGAPGACSITGNTTSPPAPTGFAGNRHWFDNYHTYGFLTTTDGSTAIELCGYIDHVLVQCVPYNTQNICSAPAGNNQSGCYGQRDEFTWWWGQGGYPAGADAYDWVEGFRVWACPQWNAGGDAHISNPGINTCYGTIITGENAIKGDQKKMLATASPQLRQRLTQLMGIAQ
jgi:hypothetical protein